MKSSSPIGQKMLVGFLLVAMVSCFNPSDYEPIYSWSNVEINSEIKGSNRVEKVIAPYRVQLDSIMDEVIGYAAHDLTTEGDYESLLGIFVTKLLIEQSRSTFIRDVDVAIMNHKGGLRAPINKGDITLGEVYEMLPFENNVLLLEVPGEDLVEVVNFIAKSGRSMIWPASFEITDSGVQNIRIDGQEINPDETYTLSISDYLANGGGGFRMLKSLKRLDVEPVNMRDLIVLEIRQRTARGDSIKEELSNSVTVLTK